MHTHNGATLEKGLAGTQESSVRQSAPTVMLGFACETVTPLPSISYLGGGASLNLIGDHSGRGIAERLGDVLDVAVLMDGLTVFIGAQFDSYIDWLGADCTRYFQ